MPKRECPHCGAGLPPGPAAECPACGGAVGAALTRYERRVLAKLAEYRHAPPTVGRLWRQSLGIHLILVALLGGYAAICAMLLSGQVALVLTGVLVGTLARDLAWFRAATRSWPIQAALMDFDEAERLLRDDAPAL